MRLLMPCAFQKLRGMAPHICCCILFFGSSHSDNAVRYTAQCVTCRLCTPECVFATFLQQRFPACMRRTVATTLAVPSAGIHGMHCMDLYVRFGRHTHILQLTTATCRAQITPLAGDIDNGSGLAAAVYVPAMKPLLGPSLVVKTAFAPRSMRVTSSGMRCSTCVSITHLGLSNAKSFTVSALQQPNNSHALLPVTRRTAPHQHCSLLPVVDYGCYMMLLCTIIFGWWVQDTGSFVHWMWRHEMACMPLWWCLAFAQSCTLCHCCCPPLLLP